MRLVHDHSTGASTVDVPCLHCGRMVRLADAAIDIHGPAFRAYYCPACTAPLTAAGWPIWPCDRPGCTRCEGRTR